jgi:hypothetical protein
MPLLTFTQLLKEMFFCCLWCFFLFWFIHLNWSDLEKVVLGHELVDGLEPVVRGVGVPTYGQQQGVLVSYPGHLKISIIYWQYT